ncbi:MAG TPA: DUF1572 family protein [Bacteroidia bacterium]|jgi:hypothetical protein|nr:DUF1572 family protein [Bacteroidia bacterium]
MNNYLEICRNVFQQYKQLGEKAMTQLDEKQLNWSPTPESNSIVLIIKHLYGNMLSRWTDFLTTDGEKDWRDRDAEFVTNRNLTREELNFMWEDGWALFFRTLYSLNEDDLDKIIKIRGEDHTVIEALQRQTAHYSSHIGQIIYIAKICKDKDWNSLSIPRGMSKEFNEKLTGKKY